MITYEEIEKDDILENENGQYVKVVKKFTWPLLGWDSKKMDKDKEYYMGDVLEQIGTQKLVSVIDVRGNKMILIDDVINDWKKCTKEGIKDMLKLVCPKEGGSDWVKCINKQPISAETKNILDNLSGENQD